MPQWLRSWWFKIRQGLWFYPSLMTAAAMVLAFAMLALDQGVLAERNLHRWWLFRGGAEGARGVLTTIAGTMITVATTVFSITIVALQLGASQLSPRVLRGFTADRGNQLVLGTFIATFTYTLLVLRMVQSESADRQVFVPAASVSLAILLALTAIGSLIYYLHHATRTIQPSVVIDRTLHDTLRLVEAQLVQQRNRHKEVVGDVLPPEELTSITTERSGYLTGVDVEALLNLAAEHHCVIAIALPTGAHVLSTTAVAAYADASHGSTSDENKAVLEEGIRDAFHVEIERTLEQDVRLGFRQLADIAVKALSPGINDAATAVVCIDRLGEALLRAHGLRNEPWSQRTADGVGVVHGTSVGFADVLDECLPQIRHYGAGDVVVMRRLLHALHQIGREADVTTHGIIAAQARLIAEEATAVLTLPTDRRTIEEAARWAG